MICFHPVQWIQVLLSRTNNSIQYQSFVCTQWSAYNYCYSTLFSHLLTVNGSKYCNDRAIGLFSEVFDNGPGDQG